MNPMRLFPALFLLACSLLPSLQAQTNITLSNPAAEQILLGNYDPSAYTPSVLINNADSLLNGLLSGVSKDSLRIWLQKIDTYQNRNTGSDTVSQVRGIGAVRRWIYSKFGEFSISHENRLVTSYMDFDQAICGQTHHRNVLAILPGLDTTKKEILVLEGHFDTRCNVACDTSCYTPGMEDNGSGTVLVMQLAQVLSRFAFGHTILFACVTGEDQGLYGAKALSTWLYNHDVAIRACMNNDVIGGIICGNTSSPPSCPYMNHMDSTHVRIFSFSPFLDSLTNSPHKQLARYVKMHQVERINPQLSTPMEINIMLWEDRQGRSGDHIPFRQKGYTAIRFVSQNEHGNGQGIPPDRQHTSDDVLGLDLSVPPDGTIDTFFVDMNYLRRNTIMNGLNIAFLALAPPKPQPIFSVTENGIKINLTGADSGYQHYRVGLRTKGSGTLYFDTIYTFLGTSELVISGLDPDKSYFFSVASVENNIESLFSDEFSLFPVGVRTNVKKDWGLELRQNRPNPFSGSTVIEIEASRNTSYPDASLVIRDIAGREIQRIPVQILFGSNTIPFTNTSRMKGIYTYSLEIGGKTAITEKMAVY